jgi:polyphosphate glucokinase
MHSPGRSPGRSLGRVFGLDIGGSGIKGAIVDLERGELATERVRLATPAGAKVADVAEVAGRILADIDYSGVVGAAFPAVITAGVARTAANIDDAWIGTDVAEVLSTATGHDVTVVNDADAAGIAEMRYGAGRGVAGTVLMLTLGTGIGSALFRDGRLVPNTEFGHLELEGHVAETRASDAARDRDGLDWGRWAHRLSKYLRHLELLTCPDLVIIGGGVSKKSEKYLPLLEGVRTDVVPATLLNDAGMIGAALWAVDGSGSLVAPNPVVERSARG